jgi:hypothetical protein
MASIADARHPARRWSLAALLRWIPAPVRHHPRDAASHTAASHTAAIEAAPRAPLRSRRFYAPPRDAFLENSAMRREMFRL